MTFDGSTTPTDPAPAGGAANGTPNVNGMHDGRSHAGTAGGQRDRIAAAAAKIDEDVRRESRITGIPLVFWKDGRCVWEDADGNPVPEPDWARRFRETGEPPPVLFPRVG